MTAPGLNAAPPRRASIECPKDRREIEIETEIEKRDGRRKGGQERERERERGRGRERGREREREIDIYGLEYDIAKFIPIRHNPKTDAPGLAGSMCVDGKRVRSTTGRLPVAWKAQALRMGEWLP